MKVFKLMIVFVFTTVLVAACSQQAPNVTTSNNSVKTPQQTPTPTVEKAALTGAEIYTVNCMTCHKDSGKGGKVTVEGKSINAEDLTATKFKAAPDEKLIRYVTNGIEDEGMPAFRDKLTTEQIKSVINHVRTLQK